MSATPTPNLEGTQAPSQVELLWERYRSLAYTLIAAVVLALGGNSLYSYWQQSKVDKNWSAFAAMVGLDESYTNRDAWTDSLSKRLATIEAAKLQAALPLADDAQKPFVLMAIARRAIFDKQWEVAEQALRDLESKYPLHSLVRESAEPVQSRNWEKPDPAKPAAEREPKPAVAGSQVSRVRAEIEAAKAYQPPAHFARVEPPADARKFKLEFSGGYGHCVIALMPNAPLTSDAVWALAKAEDGGFWKDIAVDQIRRPAKRGSQPRELHFGLESTKTDDREKWTDTEPSKHIVDFEQTGLSHFPGAVSASSAADGKSAADRLWIAVDDAAKQDGSRVVFGYVVEGLDNLKRICDAAMSAQEEERGEGRPSETIRITAVTVL